MNWVGAQTLVGQVMAGNPSLTWQVSFCNRLGHLAFPVAAGAMWDAFGPWGGFTALSLWGGGFLFSVIALPVDALSEPTERRQSIVKSVTPRLVDYIEAFKFFALPLMALVLAMTVIRQFGSGMQSAFYAVYLEGIGMPGTLIGILVSANGLTGIVALGTGALVKRIKEFSLLIWCIVISIVAIAIVPFFSDFIPLFIASSIRGGVMAISVVIIVSLIARTVGPTVQGRAMGLRTTCNQAANVSIPIIMGGLAHFLGLELAFYIVGAVGIALALMTAFLARGVETPPL